LCYHRGVPSPTVSRIGHVLTHPYLTLAARLVLGGVFIFAGATKLGQLPQFAYLVHQYGVLPYSLSQVYGYVLPPLEVVVGTLLILGVFLRTTSVISGLIVLSFIIAKSIALARGMNLTCGCFGEAAVMLVSQSLAIDFLDIALALQILFHRGDYLALGPWLKQKGET